MSATPAPPSWPFRLSLRDGRWIVNRVPKGARKGSRRGAATYPTDEEARL